MSQHNENTRDQVTTGELLEQGGFFVAYNLVMRNAITTFDLTKGEYSCLVILLGYVGADPNSQCFPSQVTLAKDLQTSPRTVREYLDGLEEKGCIVIYNTYNKRDQKTNNIYDVSPCLNKIRELFCTDIKQPTKERKVVRRAKKTAQTLDTMDGLKQPVPFNGPVETTRGTGQNNPWDGSKQPVGRVKTTRGTGQNTPTINNNIQSTNTNNDSTNNHHHKEQEQEPKEKTGGSGQNNTHTVLSYEHTQEIYNKLLIEYKDLLPTPEITAAFNAVCSLLENGKITHSFEGAFRDRLNRSLANKSSSQPNSNTGGGGKQPTRKEVVPEWLEEQKRQEQQQATMDLEEERRRLEEELKVYKKD